MTLPETLDHILDRIVTVSDRAEFLEILDGISRDAFNVKTDIEKTISDTVPESFASALFAYFKQANIDSHNAQKVSAVLTELKETLSDLPLCTIRIAVEPTRTMLLDIRNWIQTHTGQTVILKVIVDPRLIAGAVIEWNGAHKDSSFRQAFADKKEDIMTRILS